MPVYCQFQKSLLFFSKEGGGNDRSQEQEVWLWGTAVGWEVMNISLRSGGSLSPRAEKTRKRKGIQCINPEC